MALKKNILANYIGQFYVIIIGIVMVPYYLKYLGAEAYGLVGFFALMQSWMSLLDMGFSPTLSREVAKVLGNRREQDIKNFTSLFKSLEFLFMIVAILVTICIVVLSDWISSNWLKIEELNLNLVAYCIELMGVMIGLRFLSSLYRSGINGAEVQVWLNKINIILVTFRFVGVLFILEFISQDVKYFFEYQLIISLIEFFLFTYKFYSIIGIKTYYVYFSYKSIRPILPFALGIAYTSGIWILLTQLDKLLLSTILPLKEYGYFALIGMITNAIIQVTAPISKAILPRMTNLLAQGKDKEMISIYKQSTQIVALTVFSIVGIVAMYSYQLLYSWTGNLDASIWGKDILSWYVLGNAILAIGSFQYYLQFAYGKLKMHVYYNTISAFISVPIIIYAAYSFGAIGVAITWFVLRLVSFIIWTPIVHHKFAPGLHKNWILHDIMPIALTTFLYLILMQYIGVNFNHSRSFVFLQLLVIGFFLISINAMVSSVGRNMIIKYIKRLNN